MSRTSNLTLPPNPYRRSPIRKRHYLAGRERELKSIQYYLSLTASGQNPHLALIGQRGVGKTSLLNGAESIARESKLLSVRLDMNEQKASSPGRFWHDLYQTLALSMVKIGCWGGIQGPVYANILQMLYSPQPGNLQNAVMQVPYLFSCSQGNIDSFECPDALVESDLDICVSELKSMGFSGIAFLIDEADCLGKNISLLQMFRNIFQVVEHCSLILAGTDAVFPALSEVFSPIPRQFHRIDVKPFASWSDTEELVKRPLTKELYDKIVPGSDFVREMHKLCGGAPDEVQLYCHHMYRFIEEGVSTQMLLSPEVFRAVLHEYRSNSPADIEGVLNAIERLPDKLLYKEKWVSRRTLTLEENIQATIVRKELKLNKALSEDERKKISNELAEGYQELFEAGIIEVNNRIDLVGSPLTAGFWKSFVQVERNQRWVWNDRPFIDFLFAPIIYSIGKYIGALGHLGPFQARDSVKALRLLREGKVPGEFDEGMFDLILAAFMTVEEKTTHAVDVIFQTNSPAGKNNLTFRFFEEIGNELKVELFQKWIDDHRDFMERNDISFVIEGCDRFELPSFEELHRLGYILRYPIPTTFGPSKNEQAITLFENGNIQGCMNIFSKMLDDRDDATIRNNLAFCQILTGNISIGLENVTKSLAIEYHPLYEMNKGVAEFLLHEANNAKISLRNALQQYRISNEEYISQELYLLVLESTGTSVSYHQIPLDLGILINLYRIGDMDKKELEEEITKLYPDNSQEWLEKFTSKNNSESH